MSIRYVFNLVFNGPCTMAGSSVLDSMIVVSSHEPHYPDSILEARSDPER